MTTEIKTERGRKKMLHDGFLYVFEKPNARGDVKFWKCEFFGTQDIKCKGRLHTDLNDNVLEAIGMHTCPSGAENVEVKRLTTVLKNRAGGTMESHSVLRATTLENVPTPVLARFPDKDATKKVVKRVRRDEDVPYAVPASIAELQIPVAYSQYHRSENTAENFLLGDSGLYAENSQMHRILIFGRASHGEWAGQMTDVFADGTFIIAPPLFYQVYAILARRRERWVFPVAYALLTNKSEATYSRMWALLKEAWPEFSPRSVSVDFEMAAINSIRNNFPDSDVRCCLFHLVQNMKKRLAENNLLQRYKADPVFAAQTRWITSLAFMPIGDLTHALISLEVHLLPELRPILVWFATNYTGRVRRDGARTVPMFVPQLWSVYSRTINGEDRTNNFAEAAHRRLQRAFSCTHPSVWRFIDTLRKEQKLRDADMALCVAGHDPPAKARRYQEADRRILTLTRNYTPLNIGDPYHVNVDNFNPQTIIDFLAGISHNYAMDP